MNEMFNWIDKELVIALQKMQINRFGGSAGLRDNNLLESALASPKNYSYFLKESFSSVPNKNILALLAGKYAYSIIKNHPFIDGNKRIGLIILHLFLELHDHQLIASEEEQYLNIIRLASGTLSEESFLEWITLMTEKK
jgi:death-on-curing protein